MIDITSNNMGLPSCNPPGRPRSSDWMTGRVHLCSLVMVKCIFPLNHPSLELMIEKSLVRIIWLGSET